MIACVLGEIDLVSALGLAGVRSVVMAGPGSPSLYSRFTAGVLDHVDARAAPDVRVERLLAFAAEQAEPPVLYYDGDWDTLMISRNRDALTSGFRFVVADADLVESLIDKERFRQLADHLELPVPPATRLAAGAEFEVGLRYPVVVKPLTRHEATWRPIARSKALRIDGAEQLRLLGERLSAAGVSVLVQEAVLGPESRIESYHVYVDDSRSVAAEFTGRKLRTYPNGYGYSTALVTTASEDVRRLGREIVARLDLTGVAKLDFKRDESGALHLLEVNPRFNLWHHLGALAGVNIPAIVHADLTGMPRPAAAEARPGVRWLSLSNDLRAARAGGWSTARWLRWAASSEAKSGFSWRDPFPLPRAYAARRTNGR